MVQDVDVNVKDVQYGRTTRKSYSKINEILEMPNLIAVQKDSYQHFKDVGLKKFLETYHL